MLVRPLYSASSSASAAAGLVESRWEEPKRRAKSWGVELYRGGGRGLGFINRWVCSSDGGDDETGILRLQRPSRPVTITNVLFY